MKVKIFLEKGAKLPKLAHDSDFGYDMYVQKQIEYIPEVLVEYSTGVHVDFPPIYNGQKVCMQIFSRSSIFERGLMMCNSIGIVDSGYHGPIMAHFYKCMNWEPEIFRLYEVGDRFLQLAMSNGEPIEWEQVQTLEELGTSERGFGGHGSTGK